MLKRGTIKIPPVQRHDGCLAKTGPTLSSVTSQYECYISSGMLNDIQLIYYLYKGIH